MLYAQYKKHILGIFLVILFGSVLPAYAEQSIQSYDSHNRKIQIFKTKIVLLDDSLNTIDSYHTKPWIVRDCSMDPQKRFLFVILGKAKALRGERLAIFSVTSEMIEQILIDRDRGFNPWKIICKDVDGDSQLDICVGVWKKTRFHPTFDNRLFIYSWDGKEIFPKWLGSRLSCPFVDFDFQDIDGDGTNELLALEKQKNRLRRVMSYKWKGFGFEGMKVLAQDLEDLNLSQFLKKDGR